MTVRTLDATDAAAPGRLVAGAITAGTGNTYSFTPTAGSRFACGAQHRLDLLADIKDAASNALAPTNRTFRTAQIDGWSFVDGATATSIVNRSPTAPADHARLVEYKDKLYAAWIEGGRTRVAVYNGNDAAGQSQWTSVGKKGRTTGIISVVEAQVAESITLAVFDGKLYAAWVEWNSASYQLRVAVYNDVDDWTQIEGSPNGLNGTATRSASNPQLATVGGKLYVLWTENYSVGSAPGINHVRIKEFGGGTTWTFIGGSATTGINHNPFGDAFAPHMIGFAGKLYAAWDEAGVPNPGTTDPDPPHQIRLKVFDPAAAAAGWRNIDGSGSNVNSYIGLNFQDTFAAGQPHMAVLGGKLYMTWGEMQGTLRQIRVVRVRTENTTATTVPVGRDAARAFVDGGGTTGINYNVARSAAHPYSAYVAGVRNPDPTSPIFVHLDMPYPPRLAVANSQLYAIWSEATDLISVPGAPSHMQVRAKVFNGSDTAPVWTSVNGTLPLNRNRTLATGDTETRQHGLNPTFAAFGNKLYAAWTEANGTVNSQIRVALATCP